MIAILRDLYRLLDKHDHPGQAKIVARLIELHDSDQTEFVRLLQSVDMWGGSGAVWEVSSLGSDTGDFRSGIIRLAQTMEESGLGMERTRFISQVFQDWNKKGL